MGKGNKSAVPVVILGALACLLAGHANSQVIQNHLIVEYTSRPASMAIVNDSLDTGQADSDDMINREPVDFARFLWADETPQRTFLSKCLLVVYADTLSMAGLGELREDLGTRGEVAATYLNSYLIYHDDLTPPADDDFYTQWNLHSPNTGYDIDWLRAYYLGDANYSASAVLAVIDNSSLFKSSFDAPGPDDLIHLDYDWASCWFNPAEDQEPYGVFDEDDLFGGDSAGDPNDLADDVIGWDFSACFSPDPIRPPWDPCDGLGCVMSDGMCCWDGLSNGDPFPHTFADHGGKVVGIIGATTNNEHNISGIINIGSGAHGVDVMHLKTGLISGTSEQGAAALEYARLMGAEVINMSWGDETTEGQALLAPILDACHDDGIVLVASAANEDNPNDPNAPFLSHFPATHDKVISVAATTKLDTWRWDSCYEVSGGESGVDIAAPGEDIPTLKLVLRGAPNEPCAYSFGDTTFNKTSAAAPHVSACAALLIANDPAHFRGNPDALYYRLTRSAQKIDYNEDYPYIDGVSERLGYGRLNLFYAINYVEGSQSDVSRHQPASTPTVVTCPGDSADDLVIRMSLRDEFGDLVAQHPDTLAKVLEITPVSGAGVQLAVDQDPWFMVYLDSLRFSGRDNFLYAKTVASEDGTLDVTFADPQGWGTVAIKGRVIDAAENRFRRKNPNEYLEGSFFHAEFAGTEEVIFTTVDLDDDGDVDVVDWSLFAPMYGTRVGMAGYCACADYNADGSISTADMGTFSSHYGH